MNADRHAVLGDLAAGLRTPLARIALSASALARDAATPSARQHAERIGEAVADLDRRLAALGAALAPEAGEGCSLADAAPILADLHRRVAPALAARGIDWAAPPAHGVPVPVDGERLRLLALALLRAAGCLAGRGACLSLEPVARERAFGLALAWHGGGDAPAAGEAVSAELEGPALAELEALALAQRGAIEQRETPGGQGLVLWLPIGEATCPSS
jgi:hypothetical protein